MSNESPSTLTFTLAQVVGTIIMTLASVYWVAIDYPDWLPDAVLDAIPRPPLGTAAKWTLLGAGSLIGWAMYQWGTVRKARRVTADTGHR